MILDDSADTWLPPETVNFVVYLIITEYVSRILTWSNTLTDLVLLK